MPVAYNSGTGEAVMLDPSNQWVPTQTARNPDTGETVAFDGKEWLPVGTPSKPDAGQPASQESWGDFLMGLGGEVAQGATFNYGDEAKAGLRTMTRGGTYDEHKAQVDHELADFERRHPGWSMFGNFVGGAGLPSLGWAKAGGRGLAGATAANAVVGGATGAVAGSGTGNTIEERALNAAATGSLGTVVGAAAPTVIRSVGAIARGIGNVFGRQNPAASADRMVLKALEREGLTPDEAAELVRSMQSDTGGAPVALADVGDQTQRLARAVQTVPSTGSTRLMNFLESRQSGAGERMVGGIRRTVGTDAQNVTEEALRAAREAESAPLYDRAFRAAPVHNDRVARMVADPVMRQGIRQGLEIQRLEALARNEAFNPADYAITGFDAAGDPIIGQVPNMRLLDAAKRGLDEILEQYRDSVTGRMRLDQRGRAINEVRRALISELDGLNPDYRAARAAYAGPSQSIDAMEAGRSFMRGDVEDVDSFFSGLSPGDRDYFLIGLSRELRNMVDKRPTALSDATQRIMRPQVRQRLERFLQPGSADALDRLLQGEQQMSRTYRTAGGGSPTGRIDAEQSDAGAQEILSFLTNLLRGNWGTAAGQAVRRGQGLNEATANQLAHMLTTWSPSDLNRLAARLNEVELTRRAAQDRTRAAGRRALSGTLTSVPAAMEDRR